MKSILITLSLAISLISPAFVVIGQAAAVDVFNTPDPNYSCGSGSAAGSPDVCQDANSQKGNNAKQNNNPIINIIKSAIDVLSYIIGAAAIIGIVVSGIRLTTSGGDSNAVASARSGLVYSMIGIAVVALAQVIVAFVLDKVQ